MNNDRGLLSGSITILIGAVIAIMALVRGPWQVWLLLGIFTLWGLWVNLHLGHQHCGSACSSYSFP